MTITKTILPENSVLKTNHITYDYMDSFQGMFIDKFHKWGPTDIGKSFFSSGPKWINHLMVFRNKLVGYFGLKTSGNSSGRQKMLDYFKGEKGDQIGLFKVFDKTPNEIILGQDDKHLNFRVSIFIDEETNSKTNKKLIISTAVKFNNWLGRLYFLPVKPFHKIIVPTMLKGIIRNIEKQNNG